METETLAQPWKCPKCGWTSDPEVRKKLYEAKHE
jgi:hypothetical protein